jgi:hypothetical protein
MAMRSMRSCFARLLQRHDLFDGLVDLYLIVDGYSLLPAQDSGAGQLAAAAQCVYTEIEVTGRVVRAKYAVLSSADLRNGVAALVSFLPVGPFHPTHRPGVVRDGAARRQVNTSLANAAHLSGTGAARLPPPASARSLAAGPAVELWRGTAGGNQGAR